MAVQVQTRCGYKMCAAHVVRFYNCCLVIIGAVQCVSISMQPGAAWYRLDITCVQRLLLAGQAWPSTHADKYS